MTMNTHSPIPLPDGIDELTQDECDRELFDFGFRGEHHTVFVRDWGATAPDTFCDLVQRCSDSGGKPGYVILARLELHEIEPLIKLLQVARISMIDLCE